MGTPFRPTHYPHYQHHHRFAISAPPSFSTYFIIVRERNLASRTPPQPQRHVCQGGACVEAGRGAPPHTPLITVTTPPPSLRPKPSLKQKAKHSPLTVLPFLCYLSHSLRCVGLILSVYTLKHVLNYPIVRVSCYCHTCTKGNNETK